MPGTYTAWLSDSSTDAKDRVTNHPGPYVLTSGFKVADDFSDILDCTNPTCLQASIGRDEFGEIVFSLDRVWTGTGVDGRSTGNHCSNWTTDNPGATGTFGDTISDSFHWTARGLEACDLPQRLYCFED